jgi:mxaJ protein
VRGYTIDGGEGPAAQRIVQALADGQLDAALVWGPQAGYFAGHASQPMKLSMAHAPEDMTMPFEFGIAIGVRKGDPALRDALQAALDARRAEVDAVLAQYAVPRTDREEAAR